MECPYLTTDYAYKFLEFLDEDQAQTIRLNYPVTLYKLLPDRTLLYCAWNRTHGYQMEAVDIGAGWESALFIFPCLNTWYTPDQLRERLPTLANRRRYKLQLLLEDPGAAPEA